MQPVITLTTDFGTRDCFVGAMKGVILNVTPAARIVDLSHEVAPQDIWEAGFTLASAYRYFPRGTVHVAVVDPGVGSGRRPIIAVTEGYFFVGPDNGIFSHVYREAARLRVHHITSSHYFLPNPGPTFHGRDIFAPVAAWLARGIPSGNFGDEITDFVKLNIPVPTATGDTIEGHVIHIDRFGNVITNISYQDIRSRLPEHAGLLTMTLVIANREISGLKKYYAEASPGEPAAIINSSGLLEVFVYKQNARTALGIKRGDPVRFTIRQG